LVPKFPPGAVSRKNTSHVSLTVITVVDLLVSLLVGLIKSVFLDTEVEKLSVVDLLVPALNEVS